MHKLKRQRLPKDSVFFSLRGSSGFSAFAGSIHDLPYFLRGVSGYRLKAAAPA
jgi:hypothetical protein